MWPKAIAQLLELAPHVTRLVPVADRYLQSKAEARESHRRALQDLNDSLRGDLSQIAAAHAGLYRQLHEQIKAQTETLTLIAADIHRTRLATEDMEPRLNRIENRVSRLWITFFVVTVLAAIAAVASIMIFLILHLHGFMHAA
jgi:exonuclease VII large subunit